jgi:hypothetical protein
MFPAVTHRAMQIFPGRQPRRTAPTLTCQLRQRSAKQSRLKAFRSFAHAALSLENSYSQHRAEVRRLRRELEKANQDLTQSLEDYKRMRAHLFDWGWSSCRIPWG